MRFNFRGNILSALKVRFIPKVRTEFNGLWRARPRKTVERF